MQLLVKILKWTIFSLLTMSLGTGTVGRRRHVVA